MSNQRRTDFEDLLGAPRKLFEEFSEKYGYGARGEVSFGSLGFIRPLHIFGVCKDENSKDVCLGALQLREWEESARLSLLWRMPRSSSELDSQDILRINPLIEFFAGRDMLQEYSDEVQWRHQASVHLGRGYEGFELLVWAEYWPVMNEMIGRFSDLVADFPQLRYEKRQTAA